MMPRNAIAKLLDGPKVDLAAGECFFIYTANDRNRPVGVIHGCPCGCGGKSVIWFKDALPGLMRSHAQWTVVGEWPAVTLEPSIGVKFDGQGQKPAEGYHWHGWLRDGVFEEG